LSDRRTSFERATAGYDETFEQQLADAITAAIAETSMVTDAIAMVIRTGETIGALVTTLAAVLAMSPAATRPPTQMRKTLDELGKRLRRRLASAEADPATAEFLRRTFNTTDSGGHA
jgi:hypothetical protein